MVVYMCLLCTWIIDCNILVEIIIIIIVIIKGKIHKFVNAESNNWNERGGINNKEWIDGEEWRRKTKL